MKRYKVISLFSGAMGLDLGLEKTGRFEVLAAVEKEKVFCDTIRTNRDAGRLSRRLKVFERDVAEVDPQEILKSSGLKPGEVDVLVGGPPCQSFSTAGRRRTTQDTRGTLLWDFLRFVRVLRPRFFLMENVRGLLSAAIRHRPIKLRPNSGGRPLQPDEEAGSVVRLFAGELQHIDAASYHMDCFEVNAVNYGAPQLRERAFFVGNRYNDFVDFPDPTHGSPEASRSGQHELFGTHNDETIAWRTLGDTIRGLKEAEPVIIDFSPRKKSYLAKVPAGSNWRSLPMDIQRESMGSAWSAKGGRSGWWRRLSFDLPCPTLVTMPNHASTALCHPDEVRALTLREYAAIQEFPVDWCFRGTPAQQYEQAGNAVPLRLGTIAGEVIAEHLDTLRQRRWQPYRRKQSSYRVVYIQSHVRTRQWYKNGRVFVRSDGGAQDGTAYGLPKVQRKTTRLTAS